MGMLRLLSWWMSKMIRSRMMKYLKKRLSKSKEKNQEKWILKS
jgi:hypothetical protein